VGPVRHRRAARRTRQRARRGELVVDVAGQGSVQRPALRDLSAQVLVEGRAPADVAQDWLRAQGLL
jgi:DNA-directed RNA polymerase subunit K/omega